MTTKGATKKSDASSSEKTKFQDVESFQPLYSDMFDGATYGRVDPFSCIAFTKIRTISNSGVERLVSLFDNQDSRIDDTPAVGLAAGSDTPIVVPLVGSLFNYVISHLISTGMSADQALEKSKQHPVWHGIVDGLQSNTAVRWLIINRLRWKKFKWFVTILKGGFPVDRYRQLARFQNHRHSPKYNVSLTFYDELFNLKSEYERLKLETPNPTNAQVARTYFGTTTASRTMTMMASLAIRLGPDVMTTLGKIVNSEFPEICIKNKNIDSHGATTADEVKKIVDCRIYRSFVKMNSLYTSTCFMNPKTPVQEQAQVNTLYRVRDIFTTNGFRTIQHRDVTKQYLLSMNALKEEEKFLCSIKATEWPQGMEKTRETLLRSVHMDKELEANRGNEHKLLEPIVVVLKRVHPDLVDSMESSLKKKIQTTEDNTGKEKGSARGQGSPKDSGKDENEESDEEENDDSVSEADDEASNPPIPENEPTPSPEDIEKLNRDQDMDKLQAKGIHITNETWNEYKMAAGTTADCKVELVITEPPPCPSRSYIHSYRNSSSITSEIDKKEISEFPQFCKWILKPGGYVILLLQFFDYQQWYDAFYLEGFEIMPHPYVFMFSSESIQNRNSVKFPQNACQFGMFVTSPDQKYRD